MEGFGGDDARTSIFDYWSMPEFCKWVNGHRYDGGRLSPDQKALREFYSRLINLVGEPAFRDGEFFPLNPPNRDNPNFGRLEGEVASGHWLYAFLRYDGASGQRFLVMSNLHSTVAFCEIKVLLSPEALRFLNLPPEQKPGVTDRLSDSNGEMTNDGVWIAEIKPLSAAYLEFLV